VVQIGLRFAGSGQVRAFRDRSESGTILEHGARLTLSS
jgi:hypothetical protein